MEHQKSTSRYILTALAIILVITAFILVGLNALNIDQRMGLSLGKIQATSGQLDQRYKDGFLAARAKYRSMCPTIITTGTMMSGTVTAVDASSLTVKQSSFDTDSDVDGVSDLRTVNITAQTKIQSQIAKLPQDFTREMAAYKPGLPGQFKAPPMAYTVKSVNISDIKVGDKVDVTAANNVRLAQSFDALAISLSR